MDLSRNKIIYQIEILDFHFFYIKGDNKVIASKNSYRKSLHLVIWKN
jgi:hypothetical protein